MKLRDYQIRGIELGVNCKDRRLLLAAPTGAGKSPVEVELLRLIPDSVLVTPTIEIIDGLIDKGADESQLWTPIKFRNRLLDGSIRPPSVIVYDEVHHAEAESWQQVSMSCDAREIGLTATPYRGTPKSTAQFRANWGLPVWLIRYKEAIAAGYITMPECKTEPLVDDDLITVTASGEFDVQSITAVTESKLGDAVKLVESYPLDRPTMITLPTRELCRLFAEKMTYPSRIVDGDTPRAERLAAFADCLASRAVLIQIAVVSEGVDLAIRRLFDFAPTMSPVVFVQRFGRAMRPLTDDEKRRGIVAEYIGTNRNLLRFAWALDGIMPISKLVEAQDAFLGPSARDGMRVIGLEGLGRFKSNEVRLMSGLDATMYMLEGKDPATNGVRQYCCITHPAGAEPLFATRVNVAGSYGRWQRCDAPTGFQGFASGRASAPSDKQRAWWERDAAKHGLDPGGEVSRRTFACLPVLSDLKAVIQ